MTHRVVVVGGGVAGLEVAERIAHRAGEARLEVTLVDRAPHHLLRPKIPQALGARIPCAVHIPFAPLLARTPVRFLQHEVTSIDPAARRVAWEGGAIDADVLVVALGGESRVPDAFAGAGAALAVWDFDHACGIRRRIQFLADAARRGRAVDQDVAVIGGGFVGVEVASELQARLTRLLGTGAAARVTLIEARDRVLPRLSPGIGRAAERWLAARGVRVRLQTRAIGAGAGHVQLADGEALAAGTIVWAGGDIQAPAAASGLTDATGRIPVSDTLETADYRGVFALGDCAYRPARPPEAWEPSAHRAAAQARLVARNVLARFAGRPAAAYRAPANAYVVGLGPRYGLLEAGGVRAAGAAPALLKELVMLRYLASIGGWTALREAAPRVVLDELRLRGWDTPPLPDGVAMPAGGRLPR